MCGVTLLVLLSVLPGLCLADLSTAPITTDWIPRVSRKMTTFAESQTGAMQLVKAYDKKLNFTEIQIDGETQLHLMTRAAGDRLKKCREILNRNKAEIEASYAQGPAGGASVSDCCDNLGQLEYDPRFLQQIVNDSCATFTDGTAETKIRQHVYDTMKSNIHEMSGVTWQYYGAKEGEYHQFPKSGRSCEGNDHRFRNWYVSAASPKKKNVVIVMDVSGSMREPPGPEENNRLNLSKQAALTVLDTLTPRDWAGVVSFSARAKAPEGCLGDSLGEANPTNIGIMQNFINQRVPETITVYAEGFKKAFNMFHEAKNKKPEQFDDCYNIIIFLTDGQPTDTYFSLDEIAKGQGLMERSVHIFTYGLGLALQTASSGWAPDPNNPWVKLPALDFLATIADQNNHQIPGAVEWTNGYCANQMYGSCFSANRDPQGVGPLGRTDYIDDNQGDKLKTIMGSYYDFFPSDNPEPTYSVPTNDEHLGLVINAALPTIDTAGTFFGVTAVDISMDVVFHEIANFNIGRYSYAFLVDREDGRVLIHSNLPKPMEWRSEPTFLGLEAMESALRSREINKILNGDTGDYYIDVIPENNVGDLYHRLDLLYMNNATGNTQFCRLYDEYATPDKSTVMFPPEAYADPINYLNNFETFKGVADIELFINDFAGSMANPGLLDGIRTDVVLSAEIEQYWREHDHDSLWRYFGTENGVFRIFPGTITDKRYDPTRQTWYKRALSRPNDYTFSRPVPSPFGGGNMVTISRLIFHTEKQEIMGVIAADITEKYFYSMLYSEVPECLSDEYDCFMLDDSGYFMESLDNTTIYYLSTFDNNTRNMEHDHLTHRFPWLAKYLIVHGQYLRREWCNNYATQNSQMFYDTTGFIGLEVTTGPPCYQFALHPINATNTFILTLHNRQTYNCDDRPNDRPIVVGGNQVWDNSLVVHLRLLAALWSPSLGDLSTAPITTDWIPRVSRKMTTFAESQTGALQLVQEYDDKLSFTQTQIDGQNELHLLTQAVGDRLKKCREILHRNKAEIEASHAQGQMGGNPVTTCCDNLGQLEYDPRFLQQIVNDSCATFDKGTPCEHEKTALHNTSNTIRPNVYDTMKSNIHEMSGVTWQYYGAKEGEYHQFPKNDRSCHGNAHIFRNWYVSAASPKKKNVVIVIDVSLSMDDANRINLAKQAALTVLDTLTARDWVGVVSFSNDVETPAGCLRDSLGEANQGNIQIMRDFIDSLSPIFLTYYAKAFDKAFDIFVEAKRKKPEQFEDCHNVIIFLTDGVPTDPQDVLDTITEGQNRMDRSVHIFTYGLGDDIQVDLSGWCHEPNGLFTVGIPALDFLATIADQNNRQISNAVTWTNEDCRQDTYGSCYDTYRDPQGVGPPGRTDSVGDGRGDRLVAMMGSYYDFFQSEPEPTFSVPTNDEHLG
ncbi:PREDICTED: VWFA and cache domain-containing protein 1-like [Branchiostoma belcheri]|uniref:VWFA and cache domain-containing protein 1-like n=1 Tax=Branchiostoma belcheri TaxID=7741 RepID=A0A6P5A8G9_BRABE|nr:PREDICTED: VWFA and cache domain-containing protein 1-like [Branchiostoma belcheri]